MFMLDTDMCSYVLKSKSAKLAKRFEAETGKIAISEIVLAELRFGAEKHQHRTHEIHEAINDLVLRLDVVPWAASSAYGDLRARLDRSCTPIGSLDTLIAAHALQHKSVLVTNNVKHFKRVPELRIDNWM